MTRWIDLDSDQIATLSARNRAGHVKLESRKTEAQVAKPSTAQPQGVSCKPNKLRGPDIQPRKSKFSNVWTVADGIKFQSKREARRYQELKILEAAGKIKDLELQIKLSCAVKGMHICDYRADFRYIDADTGLSVIEDAKGFKTREYRIKKKLVKACLGIDIIEV